LKEPHLSENSPDGLDPGENVSLARLIVSGNSLTRLDLSPNSALTYLQAAKNKLAGPDLPGDLFLRGVS
jgi:hypothetical protein